MAGRGRLRMLVGPHGTDRHPCAARRAQRNRPAERDPAAGSGRPEQDAAPLAGRHHRRSARAAAEGNVVLGAPAGDRRCARSPAQRPRRHRAALRSRLRRKLGRTDRLPAGPAPPANPRRPVPAVARRRALAVPGRRRGDGRPACRSAGSQAVRGGGWTRSRSMGCAPASARCSAGNGSPTTSIRWRPDLVFESLRKALAEFGQARVVQFLLEAFEPRISADLSTLYADLNQRLVRMGVMPEIRYQVSKSAGSAAPARQASAAGDQPPGQQSCRRSAPAGWSRLRSLRGTEAAALAGGRCRRRSRRVCRPPTDRSHGDRADGGRRRSVS